MHIERVVAGCGRTCSLEHHSILKGSSPHKQRIEGSGYTIKRQPCNTLHDCFVRYKKTLVQHTTQRITRKLSGDFYRSASSPRHTLMDLTCYCYCSTAE